VTRFNIWGFRRSQTSGAAGPPRAAAAPAAGASPSHSPRRRGTSPPEGDLVVITVLALDEPGAPKHLTAVVDVPFGGVEVDREECGVDHFLLFNASRIRSSMSSIQFPDFRMGTPYVVAVSSLSPFSSSSEASSSSFKYASPCSEIR